MVYCATFPDTMPATGLPVTDIAAFPKSQGPLPRSASLADRVKHFDIFYGYILMKPMLSFAVISVLLIAAPMAGAQDITQGTILALDRKARLLVLQDRTVWSLELMKSEVDAGLKAGDRVEIRYQADEEGVSSIRSIALLPPKPTEEGAPHAVEGIVLVYDRKAKLLVLTDRSVWALESLKTALPAGIKAGSRVHIEFEGDEDGVSKINRISLPST